MTDSIDYDDVTDFIKALDRFPEEVDREISEKLRASTELLRGDLAEYPPETQANRPPGDGYRWYERGFGTRTVTGRAYPTSEMLGRSWTTSVTGRGPWEGRVGTTASYVRTVQDEDVQAGVHRGRWPTVQGAVRRGTDKIVELISSGIRRAIALLRR